MVERSQTSARLMGRELVSMKQVRLGREGLVTLALGAGAPGVWTVPAPCTLSARLPTGSCQSPVKSSLDV